jgi:predicted nucleic acid-binding protein
MRIADTSLLYALLSENDVHHEEAVRRMEDPETVLVPSEIWSETVSLIQHRQGFEVALMAGNDLLKLPHLELLPSRMDVIRAAWDVYSEAGGVLSFADSMVLAWCDERNASPLTFDGKILGYFGAGCR